MSDGIGSVGPRIRMPQELRDPTQASGLGGAAKNGDGTGFIDTMQEFVQGVNELQHTADAKLQSFVRGEAELHDVAIASQEASIAMRLTREIRDRLLSAYQEVMRTQM